MRRGRGNPMTKKIVYEFINIKIIITVVKLNWTASTYYSNTKDIGQISSNLQPAISYDT